jgi:hypothetical protein
MRRPRFVPYPFLAAAYPVLALAAANGSEIAHFGVLIFPLTISLVCAAGAWLLWSLVVGDPDRRAFLTFVVVILFASYGYLTAALEEVDWAAPYVRTPLPLLAAVVYLGVVTYLFFRRVPNLRPVTRYLNIFTGILVVWNTVDLLQQTARRPGFAVESRSPLPRESSAIHRGAGGPDIYLIVLDKYTGRRSLKTNFGFDNTGFETFLANHGFVVPGTSHANYVHTQLALAALLNYRYLDELTRGPRRESSDQALVYDLVEDSAVWRFLKARGYRFIFFPTAFAVTGGNRFADVQVPDPSQIPTEFEIAWRRTTLVQPILQWGCQRVYCAHAFTSFAAEGAALLEWKLDQLKQLPKWPRDGRPLFVFAHITSPHEPYVFNADCTTRQAGWPSHFLARDETPEKQAYVAQITCLNKKIETIVEHLLSDSPAPPVILLQSDHGHGRMTLEIPSLEAVTPDRLAERADIFAAYFLPGAAAGTMYDSITPVNVFRAVFRQYFDARLDRLPDETYWSSSAHPYQLTRVTGRLNQRSSH